VQILATSREALGIAGEQIWPVPALTLPGAEVRSPAVERLLESEAVRLFLDRARVQQPKFALSDENAASIVTICRRLEGLPLALELAAARVAALGVSEVAARLGESLRLLAGGPRFVPPRQRTLRATLDWSYGLLEEGERVLLRRLAVFAGGCTPEAAAAVCADPLTPYRPRFLSQGPSVLESPPLRRAGGGRTWAVLDLLEGLVRKSLLGMEEAGDVTRYRLLEVVRQHAGEHLAGAGEAPVARARHAAYFFEFVEEAWHALMGPEQSTWMDRLEREHDNLRAALQWSLEGAGDAELGLALAGLLESFWFRRGYSTEGLHWLAAALARNPAPSWVRARVTLAMGGLTYLQGDYNRATMWMERAAQASREVADTRGEAVSLNNLGAALLAQGEYVRARPHLMEALALYRGFGDAYGIANALHNLGGVALAEQDLSDARQYYEESLALYRSIGHAQGIAHALHDLGHMALLEGNATRAASLVLEALVLSADQGFSQGIAWGLDLLAVCLERCGQPETAVHVAGVAETMFMDSGLARDAHLRPLHGAALAALRARLGDTAFADAWAAGRTLSVGAALDMARTIVSRCPQQTDCSHSPW
jgi:non-specific serine/threonine protein kinase